MTKFITIRRSDNKEYLLNSDYIAIVYPKDNYSELVKIVLKDGTTVFSKNPYEELYKILVNE